jgi:signal transduction histidine kinase
MRRCVGRSYPSDVWRIGSPLARLLVTGRDDPLAPVVGWRARLRQVITVLAAAVAAWGAYYSVYALHVLLGLPMFHPGLLLAAVVTCGPLALATRRPLLAWRIAFAMLLLAPVVVRSVSTVAPAGVRDLWPWTPFQLLVYGCVLGALAARRDAGATAWAWLLSVAALGVGFRLGTEFVLCGERVVFFSVAVALGDQVRRRRLARATLVAAAERAADEQRRRTVLEARARIARELHDVVAHDLALIAIRAESAPHRLGDLSAASAAEFREITTTSRQTLAQMRRLLAVLRSETTEVDREPQPGLADVAGLVERSRAAGMPVRYRSTATSAVPAPVGLAAYRIVQEALANAARHAPGSAVEVTIADTTPAAVGDQSRELVVSVLNDRPAAGRAPADGDGRVGHGLLGMRERAAMLGGTVVAQPTNDGGFAVTARLPCGGSS